MFKRILFFEQNQIYDFQSKLEVLTNFYYRLGIRDDLGSSIPIMKWSEVLQDIVGEWKLNDTFDWIDNTMIPILSDIERKGHRSIGKNFLIDLVNLFTKKHVYLGNIFTEYNPYIITSRPSNRHGGINFSFLTRKMVRENVLFQEMANSSYNSITMRIMLD